MTDKELLDFIMEEREWQTFECKRAAVKPSKLLETVVAFANSEGGMLVLGIEDPQKAVGKARLFGLSENPDNGGEFLKLIEKEISPQIKLWNKFELKITNKDGVEDRLLICLIKKSDDVHSLKHGDTYIRIGNQNMKIGSQEIIRLKYEKGALKFEDESSGIDEFEELDENLLSQFKKQLDVKGIDTWQFLKDNGLSAKTKNGFELTKAGGLIFAKNPSVALRGKFGIKICHYHGTKAEFTGEPNFLRRPFTIEGPLIYQIEKALEYFRDAVRSSPPKLKKSSFQSSLLIPEWAFQEAVTNAVIHRNYSIQNDIQIRFFDNRIEIESPGTFPGQVTSNNILTERYARNPIILRTLNRFADAPNLDIGEGVNRMFEIMRQQNLYEPLYAPQRVSPHSVLLVLFNLERIEYWDIVNKFLETNYRITNQQARQITGVKDTLKMSRLLKMWVDKGLLEKIGLKDKKAIYYIRPGRNIP
ncbi:MAG: hypothetical protein EOM23_06355 [Candidatus Moranbacteria bacterium]|nr:hypothetical protein [Candidatus Moranbacteria bacterium]